MFQTFGDSFQWVWIVFLEGMLKFGLCFSTIVSVLDVNNVW